MTGSWTQHNLPNPIAFFSAVLLCCFVFLLFHEWIWYAFSILCYVELNAQDLPYYFCFLFSSAQMIYSICMLSASRAWNHTISTNHMLNRCLNANRQDNFITSWWWFCNKSYACVYALMQLILLIWRWRWWRRQQPNGSVCMAKTTPRQCS